MALVSLVVPIYNVEAYLERCIMSICGQSFRNLEIILVDDGSPDQCPAICDIYANKDIRIKVIHKKNGGLSDARNAGLSVATGDYIGFIDSDDWIAPEFVQLLLDVMIETDCDICECDAVKTYTEQESITVPSYLDVKTYNTEQALSELISDGALRQTVWNKLYKSDIIRNILFEVGKCNEDEFWTYQAFGNAKTVVKLAVPLYYYYQRPDSIMGKRYSIRRLDCIEAKAKRQNYIEEKYPDIVDLAGTNLAASILYAMQMVELHMDDDNRKRAVRILEEFNQKYVTDRNYSFQGSFKHVIWYKMQCFSLRSTARLRNLLHMNVS